MKTKFLLLFTIILNTGYFVVAQSTEKLNFQSINNNIILSRFDGRSIKPIISKENIIKIYKGEQVNLKSEKSFTKAIYNWNLGNRKNYNSKIINHEFNTLGINTITLEIKNDQGIFSNSKLNVLVVEVPKIKDDNLLPPIISINDDAYPESQFSLQQLVEDILVSGVGCSQVSNFEIQARETPQNRKSYGYFNKGGSTGFPFEEGIVISTGSAYEAGNDYRITNLRHPNFINFLPGDPDIEAALGIPETFDASFVKFNFTPANNTISFRFLMASEEYFPLYECEFSDGFAFLLRELGTPNYTNIAVLPDGTPVSVTNINNNAVCGNNQAFFEGYELQDTNYSGRTKVLTATSPVIAGRTYEIKLVVADAKDEFLDAAIFLEGGSFDIGNDGLGDDITIANGTAGCNDAPIVIQTQSPGRIHTWYLNGVIIPGSGTGNSITATQPGTYSVDIDYGGAACIISDSIIVEFLPEDDPTFTITPECDGSIATVTGTLGGSFNFNPVPVDGAIIDANTGVITNGVSGTTYTVEYITQGDCSNSSTQTVTLLDQDDATFTIAPECDGGTATVTGTLGGIFSFNPVPADGAIIDANTGVITNGVSGTTYTVEYTTQSDCSNSSIQTVTLLDQDDATFTIAPECDGGTATVTGTLGGIFSFNPVPTDGAIIDDNTGVITNGVSGTTYTVEYTTQSDCSNSSTQTVTLLDQDDATFTIASECDGGTATVTGTLGGIFSFNPVPADGAIIDANTGVITNGVSGTTYTVEYTTQGDCSNSSIQTVTLLDQDDATFTIAPECDGGTATVTGTLGGIFSFNPVPADGAIIDANTGVITNGVSGTTYTVEYTTQSDCSNSSIQTVTLLDQDDATFNITPECNGSVVTITGTLGGTFSFNPVPTDGAIIDAATGAITNGLSGTTYTVEYTTQGDCSNSSSQMVTLSDQDDATFTIEPECDGGTTTVTGTLGGIFSFNPVPTDGAMIDAATGTITNGISGTTYTVEYNTQGDCSNSSSQMVTLSDQDDATFTIEPECDGGTTTVTGTLGGIFSFNPVPTDGAMIDAATGTITNGVSGTTYTVEYTTQGDCPNSSTQTVTLLNQDDATFSITPACDGGTATITGALGGVFSFNPTPTDGALIDAATGEISNGTPGETYTVSYTTQADCPNSSTQTVTLLNQDDATFSITPACDGGTATITGALGGVFSFNPAPTDGAIIDAVTGTITNGVSGATYTVEYNTQGICANNSIVSVETLPPGNALFTITSTCDGGESTISGSLGGVFSFDPLPIDGAIINVTTGTVTNATVGASYTIVYTVNNCFATHTENLTVLPEPSLDMPEPLASCDETSAGEFAFFDLESKNMEILETTPYTTVTYHDTQAEAENAANPIASPYFSASRTVFVRAQDLTCYSTTTLELVVIALPTTINHTYELCDDTIELDNDSSNDTTLFNLISQNSILLDGQDQALHTVSYYFSEADAESGTNPLASPYENTINPQTIYVRIQNNDTLCFSTGQMILKVNPLPEIELEDKYVLCIDNEGNVILPSPIIDTRLDITNYSFEWFLNGVLITGETNATISVTQPGNYSVTATNTNTGCNANAETMVVESAPPLVNAEQVSITFVEDNTILATATNASLNTALFEFKLDDGPWVSNLPNTNTYTFENVSAGSHIITARDIEGCGEASTTIIIIDFIPYFTPNGDGFHETWNIIGLDQPDAELYIFDRFGKLLKQLNPSGNGWDGTYNDNLMPTNDYWFTLQYKNPNTGSPDSFKSHFTLKR